MNSNLQRTCEAIISNKEVLKKALVFDDSRLHTICASLYTQAGKSADKTEIEKCKKLIKSKVSAFSEIRGLALGMIACMIDIRGGQELYVDQMMQSYKTLRKEFFASTLLALSAEIMAENCGPEEFLLVTQKAKGIYKDMRSKHPFLTGEDDYLICVLLAQSNRDVASLGEEIEQCFSYLKEQGLRASGNAIQAVSSVLALYEGEMTLKCQKMLSLYNSIKEKGYKYDKHYGLPMLAVLSQLELPMETIISEMREVHDWLKTQKGFGMLLGEASRMMYAAMIVSQNYSDDKNASTSVAGGVLSAIIAEQMAMIVCISASTTAASHSN